MAKIEINGSSDDIVCVDGDIVEEFQHYEGMGYLAVSDGTLLSVVYDDGGIWRFHVLQAGSGTVEKVEGTNPDEDYSDTVTIEAPEIKYVLFGTQAARP